MNAAHWIGIASISGFHGGLFLLVGVFIAMTIKKAPGVPKAKPLAYDWENEP